MGGNDQFAKRQRTNQRSGGKGKKSDGKAKYRSHAAQARGQGVFSASGLQSGDVGIFVTCDKGKEKASLREMEDLLTEALGLDDDEVQGNGIDADRPVDEHPSDAQDTHALINPPSTLSEKESKGGIEDEIQRELAEMGNNDVSGMKRKRGSDEGNGLQQTDNSSSSKKPRLGLITLDIPCVSFIRFPSSTKHEPVKVVEDLCQEARAHPEKQRSRFVKKITPLSRVKKVMSGGIDELCQELLPRVFADDEGRGWKYAVRVNVRNNNQVNKDEIIHTVARKVQQLGSESTEEKGDNVPSRHKVDLKGYEKLVLVEVYRNIVGMAVVDDQFDALRRFNLAEIYADAREARDLKKGKAAEDSNGDDPRNGPEAVPSSTT